MNRERLRQIIKEEMDRAVNEGYRAFTPAESLVDYFNRYDRFRRLLDEWLTGGLKNATPVNVYRWMKSSDEFMGEDDEVLRSAASEISGQILGTYWETPKARKWKKLVAHHHEEDIENPYGPDITPDY